MNIELQEGFTQVCVWPGTIVCDKEHTSEDFIKFMKDQFNIRVQYLEEIITNPDIDINGKIVEGTGGRNDVFFAVHKDSVMKFAVLRFEIGIRWIEDVLAEGNYTSPIYPERVFNYAKWNLEHLADIR
jgi:histone acetyltransferase (RNA polymerase elongator complex component)